METFEELTWKANEIGLTVNEIKTKGMVQSKNTQKAVVQTGQYEIYLVNTFMCLGNICDTNTASQEIQRRINYANRMYFSLIYVFISQYVHSMKKIRIYKTIINVALMQGCETWSLL
jgi:hypothetical protein